ncbi:type II/IV secretion system protein E [Arthrobacter sp. MYb211]|uniref:TadA family conjugal transfer-associated ATPase n=1 Tax=Micrococcaceae TaxID=1268 RepID=UPI000CFBCC81|nr:MULTISPECIES: TadA family conjugal transfer-associated ATPase [unclassified Arthrobacter]PRA11268.1 type II/IV secretion system protein E [Arthrobacter sp. MYb221]PRC07559.1 type II/IV secretion system protein E [Arthrobacter sp. MYb211]
MSTGKHSAQGVGHTTRREVDERILESVRQRAMATGGQLDAVALAGAVQDSGAALGASGAAESLKALQDEVAGLSVLEPFAQQPEVTDVLVDGQGRVWTDSPRGLEPTEYVFGSAEQVRRLAVHLASLAGRRLDDASPFMDMSLKHYRVHAVLPPIATQGPLISIRVKKTKPLDLAGVLEHAACWWHPLLAEIMERELNFLVTGGTGSGKTTLLQAMLSLAHEGQRIIVVEDSQELHVTHQHVVGMQTRAANVEAAGNIELRDLVVQALRMRPDRLIVGECRGAEIRDFLAAMNTGHQGAAGTLHANSPEAVPARLAALGALAGWNLQATALQATSALDLIIHMARGEQGQRGPVALGILNSAGDGQMSVITAIDSNRHAPLDRASLPILEQKLGHATIRALAEQMAQSEG